jgi:hypothetical protein
MREFFIGPRTDLQIRISENKEAPRDFRGSRVEKSREGDPSAENAKSFLRPQMRKYSLIDFV